MCFICNMIYFRVPLICFKSYQDPNYYQHTRLYSVTCRIILWCIKLVVILRAQRLEKSLLEISRFNLSTNFVGLHKFHFIEQKSFWPNEPIHMVWYIRYFSQCLEVSKCVFIWNMIYTRVHLICFKIYQIANFDQLTRQF
jgi:hypothetical protein